MRKIKMAPQIVRLLLLTVTIVVTYLLARYFLTPSSFGQYGHYRGNALMEQASRPRAFGGKQACLDCHGDEEKVKRLAKGGHKNLSCEVCHGAAQAHIENYEVKLPTQAVSHCVRCHEADPAKPKGMKQIVSKNHYTGEHCAGCHIPHQPEEVP
jgi:hypothetical protein